MQLKPNGNLEYGYVRKTNLVVFVSWRNLTCKIKNSWCDLNGSHDIQRRGFL